VIAGGLLLEWKLNLGERRNGRRHCSLSLNTLHQLLGYLLLDYQDAYRVEALGLYAARYAYLTTWPAAQWTLARSAPSSARSPHSWPPAPGRHRRPATSSSTPQRGCSITKALDTSYLRAS